MAPRSDAKHRMVQAAQQLIRERGYHATAISDVLERSAAPRGSVYFHFPGGKAQLAMEAAEAHGHQQVQLIDQAAAQAGSARQLIQAYLDLARDGMVASGYSRGCGIAPLVTEAEPGSDALTATSRQAFAAMIDRMAFHLVDLGLPRGSARQLADAVIAAVEGALITSRALRSPSPFDAVREVMAARAATLAP
ncbi:MAG TPA: TetR/AcrR family transcriptional regulator [Streptosporangiaceae bacterium]|nr:TetR/AcrR family transcriptional regulator [Streptosporangiaceae bacterium]